MKRSDLKELDDELTRFIDEMLGTEGRRERRTALGLYLTGLLLDGERKSVEPIAARLVERPEEKDALRQRLQQAVVVSTWAESEMYRRLAHKLEDDLPHIEAFVIDDTGFPKRGPHSVGTVRQYSGTLGRTDQCQVAVSLHLAGERSSGMIGMRLYLPESWATDPALRKKGHIPESVEFKEKWRIALDLIEQAMCWKLRRHPILADAGYGDCRAFRDALDERGLPYLMRISGTHTAFPPGTVLVLEEPTGKAGRPRRRECAPDGVKPLPLSAIAPTLRYQTVRWREGSRGEQKSRFAAVRVRMAENFGHGQPASEEGWLLCEWPKGEPAPTKFYVSNLHAKTDIVQLVQLAKLRWRVERDYQEMKGELGLDHFEGRTWNGFHHHVALCALAHGFLSLRRALSPPEENAMDAADGPEGAPAGPPPATPFLPDVPATY